MTTNQTMPIPIPPDIASFTGPLLIGHFFNWGLFGVLTVQAYIYYIAFPNDRVLPTKVLAYSIYIFEVAQIALATRDGFMNFGYRWGDMVELNEIGTYWITGPIMISIISALGQMFYAWRIWVLRKSIWIPVIIVVLAVAQSTAGLWTGGWAYQIGRFSDLELITYKDTSVWLAGTALCDVIVSAAMAYTLLTSRSGVRSTNTIIVRIVRLTIETGSICAIFAILDLVFYLRFPHNNIHLTLSIALSKLYSNSLFAVLNSRMRILGSRTGDTTQFDASMSTDFQPRTGNTMISMVRRRTDTSKINASVDTSIVERRDEESTTGVETTKYPNSYPYHEDDGF